MGKSRLLAGALIAIAAGAAAAQGPTLTREQRSLRGWTSPVLTPFESESEFRRYLRDARRAIRSAEAARPRPRPIRFAEAVQDETQSDAQEPVCVPGDPACPIGDEAESLVVTGTRAQSNPSITNTQEAGVDEGDIVKQVGQFLLVLQDGRIFSVDTRPADGAGLALVDRINVYRNSAEDTWYDEMLVSGNRILITGYSYREQATELAVFRLDEAGRLTSEGVFYLSSNDYYDTENYATRLVDDRLIVYTPIDLDSIDLDEKVEWPVVRRWQAERSRTTPARGRPLLGARDIYRPVRDTNIPYLHTVSICPLSATRGGRDLACETTGFIGESSHEFHVSPTDAFVWVTADQGWGGGLPDCPAGHRPDPADTVSATLFRLPLRGAPPAVIGARGRPIDYLSLDTGGGRFRALTRWPSTRCNYDEEPWPLTYFDVPLNRFEAELREAPPRAFTPAPSIGTGRIENRFTDHYLVYGGRSSWGSYPPEQPLAEPVRIAAVPLDRPADARLLDIPHSVLRVEQAGDNVVLTGYRDDSALEISLIDLRATPRLGSTVRLPGRYESEGRSHAFNSLIGADSSGLMGLPTTHRIEQSGRGWSYSEASDVSFLAVDSSGRLAPLGELLAHANGPNRDKDDDEIDDDGVADDYECEVSCIDWYGNSRPIFTDGRVFGLAGSELIEGRVAGGRIRELRRLNITVGRPRGR